MDQAVVQSHIAAGLAKVASIIGSAYSQFRPAGPLDPLLAGTSIGILPCAIDCNPGLTLASPVPPGHPFALLLADPTQVQPGDYLVASDSYFVSRIQPLQPAWCVLCNMTMDILNTAQATAPGTNSYGGVTTGTNTLLARGWPMSVLAKTRGEQDVTKLPSDTRSAYYEVLMPVIPGLLLTSGLCLQDDEENLYDVMNIETSEYGTKLLVGIATT